MNSRARLVLRLLADFAIYDVARFLFGVRSGFTRLGSVGPAPACPRGQRRDEIREALHCALALYPKRVRCLQRSTVTARVLRRHGLAAELVIGYRPQPFMSHAWVELDGQVVDGPSTYSHRLIVIDRIGGSSRPALPGE